MTELDPGHVYELAHLDGSGVTVLRFVKREGDNYPGNVGAHEGPTTQEVLRALIARTKYVDTQIHFPENDAVIALLRRALYLLEYRALVVVRGDSLNVSRTAIENEATCNQCGHIQCRKCVAQ